MCFIALSFMMLHALFVVFFFFIPKGIDTILNFVVPSAVLTPVLLKPLRSPDISVRHNFNLFQMPFIYVFKPGILTFMILLPLSGFLVN